MQMLLPLRMRGRSCTDRSSTLRRPSMLHGNACVLLVRRARAGLKAQALPGPRSAAHPAVLSAKLRCTAQPALLHTAPHLLMPPESLMPHWMRCLLNMTECALL